MTTNDKRKHINHTKNELRNYLYLLNVCHGFEGKILKVKTELQGIKSPSAPYVSGIGSMTPADRKSDLLDKLQRYQFALGAYRFRTDRIRDFLDGLEHTDCKIVTDVYINNVSIEVTAARVFCSEKTLRRRIDEILIVFNKH